MALTVNININNYIENGTFGVQRTEEEKAQPGKRQRQDTGKMRRQNCR